MPLRSIPGLKTQPSRNFEVLSVFLAQLELQFHNSRNLKLQPFQIIDMQEYYLLVRPKLQEKTERIFMGRSDLESLKNSLLHLNHSQRKINPKLKNALQIRQSVVAKLVERKRLKNGSKYGWAPL